MYNLGFIISTFFKRIIIFLKIIPNFNISLSTVLHSRLERDKGNLHKELMDSRASSDKLNVEKAILEKDAKNHHAKLHEAQG